MTKHIHGGDVYKYDHCLDFSANCNPLGTPQSVKQAIIDSVEDLSDYPRVGCGPLKDAIADYEHTKKEYLICGNGAADLIFSLSRALNPKKALLPAPTFAEYEQALVSVGCEISRYYLKEENDFCIQKDDPDVLKREKPDIIFLCNPNNPTGITIPQDLLEEILETCAMQGIFMVVDECFLDFVKDSEKHTLKGKLEKYPGLFILKAFTKRYASLFPTFFIQYRADSLQNHVVGLSLGRRIDRPNYKDMNPFTYPMDNYTFYGGNPFLEPTFSYNADLNYTFKKNYTLGFNYSYIDNLISETNEQRNGIYYSRPGNFDRQISYGFTFNSSTNITKWWTFQLYTELMHNAFKSNVYTEKLDDSKWNWFVMPTNQFTISKKWSAELAGQYQTSILSGQFLISPIGSIRAGISTKILKDQGTLKLNVSDLFYTNQVEGEIRNIQNAKAGWFSYMDSRVVTLSFSYRFSKGNNLKIRQSGGSETEQSRVKI